MRILDWVVLAVTLAGVVLYGLRRGPPTVEYSLTPLGRSLDEPLAGIRHWAERYIEQVQAARDVYVRQTPAASSRPSETAPHAGDRRDGE